MVIEYISIGIITVCLIGILWVVLKKFSAVAAIDVSTIPEEKESEMKNKILADRLNRKANQQFNMVVGILKPIWRIFQRNFRAIYQSAVDLERKYRRKYRPLLSSEDLAESIDELLQKSRDFIENQNYASAEKQYIEIISLDSQNYEAYKGLADLYMIKKEYTKAQELLSYLIKLNHLQQKKLEQGQGVEYVEALRIMQKDLAEVYIDSGTVFQALGNNESAYDEFEKAYEMQPNNPRYLDLLLETAIELGKKTKAVEIFNNLKKVNPDNKKLDSFGERIKEMTL